MPIEKESDCITLNFYIMVNEHEILDLFQVEELEKRYEMGWRARVKAGPVEAEFCSGDACNPQ